MIDFIAKIIRNARYDWPLHFVLLLTNWLPYNTVFLAFRGFLASFFFKKCGKNLRLGRDVMFYNPSQIVIGDNVYIGYFSLVIAWEIVEICDEVLIGPFNVIVSGRHVKVEGSYRWGQPIHKPITIEKGSWLGSHVTVVGGVKIGSGVLVAANSVVTKNADDNAVVGGTPAKPLHKSDINDGEFV
jgi:maltose O-acetyltransferase